MSTVEPIQFSRLIQALLDESKPSHPRYLHRLSDLDPSDTALLADTWPKISLHRRESLLEDLEELHVADDLVCFEEVGRLALKDHAPTVRSRAIRILTEYELVDLLPTFVELSEYDPDLEVRSRATSALGAYIFMGEVEDISQAKLKRVEQCLLRLVSELQPALVRRKALEALGYSSLKEVIDLIEKAYNSGDTDWLAAALFAMGRSANSRWKPQVLKMLDHQHPAVRAEAASAAGELEIKTARLKLLEVLDDSDLDVRMAAIWALSQLGGAGVRQALEKLLEMTDIDDETNQIDNALENLDFTEEMNELSLFEIPEDGNEIDESSEDDVDDNYDDLISEENEV